jgi:hypothetical protein
MLLWGHGGANQRFFSKMSIASESSFENGAGRNNTELVSRFLGELVKTFRLYVAPHKTKTESLQTMAATKK